ncbi:GGDEF domain-containing protein [bacterium]|nr:GGDEF domain-containing protein [bacterium]
MAASSNQRIREIIRLMDQDRELPTLSPVVEKILRLIRDEKVSVKELADVIQNDVSLSFKILKVVNSAFYGFPRKISTLSQAMVILGLAAIKNLALSMSILEIYSKGTSSKNGTNEFKIFWERSLFAAVTARKLAKLSGQVDGEEAFMAALLQDIGILVFIKYYPEDYAILLERARNSAGDLIALEDREFGINHTLLGEFLANKWQLPRSLTIPILKHHEPETITQTVGMENAEQVESVTRIVYLSHLTSAIFYDEYHSDRSRILETRAKSYFNISKETIEELLNNLAQDVKDVATFFGLDIVSTQNYSELLLAANIELGRINLTYEQMNRELIAAKRRAEELAEQLSDANHKLEEMANLDSLTKIFNRRVFETLITREFYRSNRYGHALSCIMIDLDHFKEINDGQGHLVGDHVLREVAGILESKLRKSDYLARYGGDEFIVISPEANNHAAMVIAEKLRRAVESCQIEIEGRTITTTVSLGIATFDSSSGISSEKELVERADKNLYFAKHNGRNRAWPVSRSKKQPTAEKKHPSPVKA